MLAMSRVLRGMQPATYIESRQLLDKSLRNSLPSVYYFALICCIVLTAFCVTNPSGPLFICAVTALVALVIDLVLTIGASVPLNRLINSWTQTNYPHNWKMYRNRWQRIYNVRQAANIIGFISLLAGIIFGM
jgi:uncharacterized membrane protein